MRLTFLSIAIAALVFTAMPRGAQPAVTVEVAAFDRDGRPVRDLSAADFEVMLNGQPRAVRTATLVNVAGAGGMLGAVGPTFDAVTPAAPVSVYRLSVDAPAESAGSLDVTVKRVGVGATVTRNARAASAPAPRPGNAPPAAPMTTDDRLRAAINTGRGETALDVAIGTSVRRGADPSQVVLDVAVDIPASAAGPLQSLLGVVNARGGIGTARKEIAAEAAGAPFHADLFLPLAPGAYAVRVAAADAGGTLGFAEVKVDAKLTPVGSLLASSFLRATLDANERRRSMTRDRIPPDAKTLVAGLELYPASGSMPADVLVKIALVPASGGDAAAIERVVTPEPRDGAMAAEAEFAVDRLAAGKYTLRATVVSGATTLGTVSAAVER